MGGLRAFTGDMPKILVVLELPQVMGGGPRITPGHGRGSSNHVISPCPTLFGKERRLLCALHLKCVLNWYTSWPAKMDIHKASREAWRAASMGSRRVRRDVMTEQRRQTAQSQNGHKT